MKCVIYKYNFILFYKYSYLHKLLHNCKINFLYHSGFVSYLYNSINI